MPSSVTLSDRKEKHEKQNLKRLGWHHPNGFVLYRRNHRRWDAECVAWMKPIMRISELVREGYPESKLRQIARSCSFYRVGFATGDKRKTYFFNVEKLDKFLERRTEIGTE